MFKNLLSLFLKPNCPLCERSAEDVVCAYCQRKLISYKLKQPLTLQKEHLPIFIWGNYAGDIKRAIAAMKYENHGELADLFGYWLGKAWLHSPLAQQNRKLLVIPIPLHEKKLAERGFNQAEAIARSFCQVTGYPLVKNGLKRVRDTLPMFGLNPQERLNNINQAFTLGSGFPPLNRAKPVLIIDDIYTTGTTVKEAVSIFQQHSIKVLAAAAIASPNSMSTYEF